MWDDPDFLDDDAQRCEAILFPHGKPPRRCRGLNNGRSMYCAAHRAHHPVQILYRMLLRENGTRILADWRKAFPGYGVAHMEEEERHES